MEAPCPPRPTMVPEGARLRFDFPAHGGGHGPLCFARPRETIEAHEPGEVRAALARVDARSREGKWVVGFVCYEAGAAFDPAFRFRGRTALPLVWFGVFDAPSPVAHGAPDAAPAALAWATTTRRARYDADIAAIVAHIRAGDVYQVNHTLRLAGPFPGDSLALYERLRRRQPDGYCAHIALGRHRIVSLSPELFFRRDGALLTLKPMKGTARRGRTPASDRALGDALGASAKNRAENLMIVDLIRNDLSRIARPHTVKVPELFAVEAHPTVWQMTSTVTAELRARVDLEQIFAAMFPCGSITGAPKIKAMEIIAELESEPRGIYCGAIGLIRPGGDAVFNVAIRTLALDAVAGTGCYGAGGGITADSLAGAEYDEVLAKCQVIHGPAAPVGVDSPIRIEAAMTVG